MREILFKAKRIDNGEWVEGWLLKDEITGQYFIHASGNSVNESDKVNEEGCLRFVAFEVDESTICQFTGLLDKNGNKIWENDIVADKRYKYSVVWDEEEGSWMLETISHARYGLAGIGRLNSEKFEVIGNVFDNSELLEE